MIRFHYGLVAFAVATGLGLVAMEQSAHAAIQGEDGTSLPAASQGKAVADVIVVADNHKNYKKGDWNKGKNWGKNDEWNRRPYYDQFVGGVVLGSILAATGVGIVPYAPQPNLCWYWADPYMYRGYWDYCY